MSDHVDIGPIEGKLCFAAYKVNRAFSRYYQTLFAETGLTYPKYIILSVLSENGPLTVTQLSERAGVEANTLSPLLKRMAEFGVVARDRDAKDERRVLIALTEMGRKVLAAAQTVVEDGFVQLGLDPGDVAKALAFAEVTQRALGAADPPKLTMEAIQSEKD